MYGTGYVFSKPFFRFWVALTFILAFAATLTITLMPLIEGRKTIVMFYHTMVRGRQPASVQGLEEPNQTPSEEEVGVKEMGGGAKEISAST